MKGKRIPFTVTAPQSWVCYFGQDISIWTSGVMVYDRAGDWEFCSNGQREKYVKIYIINNIVLSQNYKFGVISFTIGGDINVQSGVFWFRPAKLCHMMEQDIENITATEGGKNQRKIYVIEHIILSVNCQFGKIWTSIGGDIDVQNWSTKGGTVF